MSNSLNVPLHSSWFRRAIESERRLERAEAEVAALREALGRCVASLDAVPGKSASDILLVDEAKKLAGSAGRG
jgi:hypothetical protein